MQHIGKLLVLVSARRRRRRAEREDRQPGPRVVKVVKFSKSGNHRAIVKKVKVLGNERLTRAGWSSAARCGALDQRSRFRSDSER